MAKFNRLSFCQKVFMASDFFMQMFNVSSSKIIYGIRLRHANVQCVYIVYTKYQDVSIKAVEKV